MFYLNVFCSYMLICSIPKWDWVINRAGGEEGEALSGM